MELEFSGPIWIWRGPSPYHFVTVPDDESRAIEFVASIVSYGWGMIPVTARVGETTWTTALWPKDGAYVVPLKDSVRRAEDLAEGDIADLHLSIDVEGALPIGE
jgi:hypothetical protein